MNIIEFNEKLESVVNQHGINDIAVQLRKEKGLQDAQDWPKILDDFAKSEKLLRIGVIGRVKAGKSSLLNALFFDGEDVLPKAATPMTASLTVIRYGEQNAANVEVYSENDIKELKEKYDHFQNIKKDVEEKIFADLLESERKKAATLNNSTSAPQIDQSALKEKAARHAAMQLKEHVYKASHDQYEQIKALPTTEFPTHLECKTYEELKEALTNYVGADGQYMPLTKCVEIIVNDERLKGIEIIDTPGLNDPIVSRSERTTSLLQTCDATLLVSPAGNFLDSNDLTLLRNMLSREGTSENCIIASKADSQLYGGEYSQLKDPTLIYTEVSNTLAKHAKGVLAADSVLNAFLKRCGENPVVCISSVLYEIKLKLQKGQSLDENDQFHFDKIKESFPTWWQNNPAQLDQLDHIKKVNEVLDSISIRKNEILKQKAQNFTRQKYNLLEEYQEALINWLSHKVSAIKNADLGSLQEKMKQLEKSSQSITVSTQELSDEIRQNNKSELKKMLKLVIKNKILDIQREADTAGSEKTGERAVEKGLLRRGWAWLTGGSRYDYVSYNYYSVQSTRVVRELKAFRSEIQDGLYEKSVDYQKAQKRKLYNSLIEILDKNLEDYDLVMLKDSIRKLMSIFEYEAPKLAPLPESLQKSGELIDSEARRFESDVASYLDEMEETLYKQIEGYIDSLNLDTQLTNLGSNFVTNLKNELNNLQTEVSQKETFIERYETAIQDLSQVK